MKTIKINKSDFHEKLKQTCDDCLIEYNEVFGFTKKVNELQEKEVIIGEFVFFVMEYQFDCDCGFYHENNTGANGKNCDGKCSDDRKDIEYKNQLQIFKNSEYYIKEDKKYYYINLCKK